MKWTVIVGVVCGLIFSVSAALAQDLPENVRHEKIRAESATPVPEGRFEFDAGVTYRNSGRERRGVFNNHYSRNRRRKVRTYHWEFGLTYGLDVDTDVTLSGGYADMRDRAGEGMGLSKRGRGLDDLSVSLKHRFYHDPVNGLSVAYLPGLTIPVGRQAESGRLGPGQNAWSFDQTLALTTEAGAWSANADVAFSLPFGRSRKFYSMRTLVPQSGIRGVRNVVGIFDANLGVGYQALAPNIQPIAELNYTREIVAGTGDSVLITTSLGAIWSLDQGARFKVAFEHPITGRNATRSRALMAGVTLPF